MKILAVDDSKMNIMLMTKVISEMGHEVICTESGEEAVALYESEQPDIILMDVIMPGMNGYEATKAIKALEKEKGYWTPVIFLTAKNEADDLALGIEAGGDDYLFKPVNAVIVSAKVKAMERIILMKKELHQLTAELTKKNDDLEAATKQLAELNKELKRLSITDGLTELYNKRYFMEVLERQWKIAIRMRYPLSIILLDIDFFKPYNDTYGHQKGDECLRVVSKALKSVVVRATDVLARYGGEEFVLLLPGTKGSNSLLLAERLRCAVEKCNIPHSGSQVADYVTISLGSASCFPSVNLDPNELIEQADKALYYSKEHGRNQANLLDSELYESA